MTRRKITALIVLGLLAVTGVAFSGASFTAALSNSGNAFAANNDFVNPTVTMVDPGTPLQGTNVTVSATASDGESGIKNVKIERAPAGGSPTWTEVCTDDTAPYSCTFDSTAGATPDGLYQFRAIATDNGAPNANTTTSSVVGNRQIDNTAPTATMNDPGANLRGAAVSLTASATDTGGSGVANVKIQRSPANADTWTDVCTDTSSPYSCTLDSTTIATPDGLYDFRAISTDNATHSTTSNVIEDRRIDNTAPTATQNDPGTNLHGTINVTGSAADTGGSGIASVTFQRRPTGGNANSWVGITGTGCASTSSTGPYSCSFDTTGVTDGNYDFRLHVTDVAGNQLDSTAVTPRRIDNTKPTTSLTNPANAAGFIRGASVALNATGADGGSGLSNLKIQISTTPSNAGSWTDIAGCTSATSPLNCTLNTTALTDGNYELRSFATDNATNTQTSTVVPVKIDNTSPTAQNLSSASGTLPGQVSATDTITLTYSEKIDPNTVLTGWAGASENITVRVVNDTGTGLDKIEFWNLANTAQLPLGTIATNQNLVSATTTFQRQNGGASNHSTMVQNATGTTITVTFGAQTLGTNATNTGVAAAAMTWTPVATPKDQAGNSMSTTPFTQTTGTGF